MFQNIFRVVLLVVGSGWLSASAFAQDAPEKPVTPVEARAKEGEKVYVEMLVQSSANAVKGRGTIYLDSAKNFRDFDNIAIAIGAAGAADLRKGGIEKPEVYFLGKKIRVRGTVILKNGAPRIEVQAASQIELVEAPEIEETKVDK